MALLMKLRKHMNMIAKAKAWIKANPKAINPWDDKAFKVSGG